jgi:two-component system, LytTR family, sensor kinase
MNKLTNIAANRRQFTFYLWIGVASLALSVLSDLSDTPEKFFKMALNETWRAIYIVALNYFFFEYILYKLSWKRIGRSVWFLLLLLLINVLGLYTWRSIGIGLHIYTSFATGPEKHIIADQFGHSIGSILFFGIIKHLYDHAKLKKVTQQLRIEKQAAELNYLKSQTNPHFLFNTLNNIYSLARDKSDLAPESILRLSKILRFMLYETGGKYIAVEQELKIMSDYIALEQLRYDDSLRINFNYDIEDMKQALPPLLLIPLVENAFKHGVSETRNHPFVDIHLSVNNRQLSFFVKNSTDEFAAERSVKENIGLTNLRRQLELLYTDFNLAVHQNSSAFTATLKINLSSHV